MTRLPHWTSNPDGGDERRDPAEPPTGLNLQDEMARRKQRALAVEADLASGMKAKDVAAKYGMSGPYVSKLVRQCGVGPRQLNRKKHVEVAEAYRAGVPIGEICERFDVKRRTVWTAVKACGVPLRKGGK